MAAVHRGILEDVAPGAVPECPVMWISREECAEEDIQATGQCLVALHRVIRLPNGSIAPGGVAFGYLMANEHWHFADAGYRCLRDPIRVQCRRHKFEHEIEQMFFNA